MNSPNDAGNFVTSAPGPLSRAGHGARLPGAPLIYSYASPRQ